MPVWCLWCYGCAPCKYAIISQYHACAASIWPIQAQYWHIMACYLMYIPLTLMLLHCSNTWLVLNFAMQWTCRDSDIRVGKGVYRDAVMTCDALAWNVIRLIFLPWNVIDQAKIYREFVIKEKSLAWVVIFLVILSWYNVSNIICLDVRWTWGPQERIGIIHRASADMILI